MFRLDTVKAVAALSTSLLFGLLVASPAFAQATSPSAQASPPGYMQLVPFAFLFVVMYVLMIRPQQKKQKDHQAFLGQLKRGDEVVTASGILGRIEGITDQFITLEIAPDVRIKILRTQVATSMQAVTSVKGEVKA